MQALKIKLNLRYSGEVWMQKSLGKTPIIGRTESNKKAENDKVDQYMPQIRMHNNLNHYLLLYCMLALDLKRNVCDTKLEQQAGHWTYWPLQKHDTQLRLFCVDILLPDFAHYVEKIKKRPISKSDIHKVVQSCINIKQS